MENIFETKTKQKGEFALVRLHKSVIERLERLNKGSPNKAITYLLCVNPESKLQKDLKDLQEDVYKIQETLGRVLNFNPALKR